ncbi:MAG: hypothetical protein QM676_11200 [Novosphingobium sp.]
MLRLGRPRQPTAKRWICSPQFGLHPLAVEDALNAAQMPKVE